jgi:tRNA U34 5-carboxymethylaminomethyl modifying GTPase MnmE/TrmE
MDAIQAEALEALARARTPLAARVYLDQLNGRLSQILRKLLTLPPDQLAENLDLLLSTASFGLALSSPPSIVLVGPPNAGKSTLFNALVGADRAITHHEPGTTRDPVDDLIAPGGIPVRLVDTAGIDGGETPGRGWNPAPHDIAHEGRPSTVARTSPETEERPSLSRESLPTPSGDESRDTAAPDANARPASPGRGGLPRRSAEREGGTPAPPDPITSAAHDAASRALANADAVLWIVDATQPVPDALQSLAASHPAPAAWVFNKCDLLESGIPNPESEIREAESGTRNPEPGTTPTYAVSALTGRGVPELASALPALADLAAVPPPGAPCVFTARQRDTLATIRAALPDTSRAQQILSGLLAGGCWMEVRIA